MNSEFSESAKNADWIAVRGVIVRGHKVASQPSAHYPQGTIEMQIPHFKVRGLDLSPFHRATLNVSLSPHTFAMKAPRHTFRQVQWTTLHAPEDFSFSACRIGWRGASHNAWIYYPHPETKERHFQDASVIELIAKYIPGITYGDEIDLEVKAGEVAISTT